jgi:hypothetical protein
MMLKQIFCNLFDLQYNFNTWWRETIKNGLYNKLKYFKKKFKSAGDFFSSMERSLIFLVKKFSSSYPNRHLFKSLKEGFFFCNNKQITAPMFKVKNGSIIQEQLFFTGSAYLIDFFSNYNYLRSF